jgi:ParB family chromosome partitioning protein
MTTTSTSTASMTADRAGEFRHVRVTELEANPRNVRGDLALDAGFRESVAANGVRQPLLITESGGALTVVAGHRRLAAAVAADLDTVPCLIEHTEGRAAWSDYVDMYTENHHRHDLTTQEEADALFGAHAEGATKTALRKATGLKRDAVNAALTAGTLTSATREVTGGSAYTWTLAELAELAEFEDDPADVKRLAEAAGTGRWPYLVERIRQERADLAEHHRRRAELEDAGYAVTEQLPETAIQLAELEHDGEPLTEETHTTCDGRGVYWVSYDPTRFIHYCDDPHRCGHTRRVTEPENKTPAGPEREFVVKANKAWKAAATVRHAFLTRLVARKTPPPEIARFVADAVTTMPTPLDKWLGAAPEMPLLAELVGRKDLAAWRKAATDKRLPLVMLASIATAYEYGLTGVTDHKTVWRTDRGSTCPRTDAGTWLRFLASIGHTLSPIEQAVADGADYTGDPASGTPLVKVLADDTDAADTDAADTGDRSTAAETGGDAAA